MGVCACMGMCEYLCMWVRVHVCRCEWGRACITETDEEKAKKFSVGSTLEKATKTSYQIVTNKTKSKQTKEGNSIHDPIL